MEWYKIVAIVLASLLVLEIPIIFMIGVQNNHKVYDYRWLFDRPIAHRGYHTNDSNYPENSKIAYQRAIDRNYNIEIDLNLTKDNKIVVFHDGTLNRMCNVDARVYDYTLEELQKLNLLDSNEHMMEFSEFLEFVDGRTGVLIEYKGEGKEIDERLCIESMKLLKNYRGQYVIQSFQPSILKWFKKNYPLIPRGQLCHNYLKDKEAKNGKLARLLFTYHFTNFIGRPNFISRRHTDINFITRLLHLYAPLLVWTIQDEKAYKKARKNHVNNVIFENLNLDEKGKLIHEQPRDGK